MDFGKVLRVTEDTDAEISVLCCHLQEAKCPLTSAAVHDFHHQMSLHANHKVLLKVENKSKELK